MRTLFWKIFAWFGAAQLLIAVALYFVASATQRGFDRGLSGAAGASLKARARAAAVAFEVGGPQKLREAWGPVALPEQNIPQGDEDEPMARNSARAIARKAEDAPENGPELRRSASFVAFRGNKAVVLVGPRLSPAAQKAVTQAWSEGSGGESSPSGLSFLARRIRTASGTRYVAVTPLRMRVRGFGPLGNLLRPDGNMTLRFSVLAFLMGAFCWGLALYVSDPAAKLSRATRRLAGGDLSVRVGAQMGRRRDELADLGRDFDAMAERIEELVMGQRRLLSDISHELRSPLARLNVALELAGDDAPPSSQAFLERIKEESVELDALIGGLLSLQRLEAQGGQVPKTPLDLAQLVARVAADVGFEAQNGGKEVKMVRLDACQLEGNAELLRSALQNVARNALLHGAGEGVEMALEHQNNQALIWVRDFGQGVPDEALDKLFDPFYRVAVARDRQSGGTGLGLSITRRAVEAHGGTVRAFNADGGGLRVEIRLPVKSAG
jgi:signal transduction histidine kinase